MYTQTHVLVASALFSKKGQTNRARNICAAMGGLAPDLPIFIMIFWSKILMVPEQIAWKVWYNSPGWQYFIDIFNSFPVFILFAITGYWLQKSLNVSRMGEYLWVFSIGALIHLFMDIFLHVHDAHAHFWPFTDWRYVSNVSYWNPEYYGLYSYTVETLLGIACGIYLFIQFKSWLVRPLILLALATYIAVPVYFIYFQGMDTAQSMDRFTLIAAIFDK